MGQFITRTRDHNVYTIKVKNNGPNDAQNVIMVDTTPTGTTFVSITGGGGFNCTNPGVGFNGTVKCTKANFASGNSQTFTLTVKVNDPFNGTIIDNSATVTSASTDSNTADNVATVNPPNGGSTGNPGNTGDDGNGGSGVCTGTDGQSVQPSPLPISQVIQATPGNVSFNSATTLINVNAGQPVQVRVSVNGDDDHTHIFVGSLSGTINAASAPFIESGSYVFTAYGGPTYSNPLGSVVVNKLTPNGTTAPSIVAAPCNFHFVCSTTNVLRTTIVKFGTGDGVQGDVTISVNGGPEKLLAAATFGTVTVNFIESGTYTFRLRKPSAPGFTGTLIGTVNVKTTAEIASDTGSTSTGNANETITPGEFALLTFDTGVGGVAVLTRTDGAIVSIAGDGAGVVSVAPPTTTTYELHIGTAFGPLATNGKVTVTVTGAP